MNAFDVPFHQIDLREKAALATLIYPQTCGLPPIMSLQKSEDLRPTRQLLDLGEIYGREWRTICTLEFGSLGKWVI